MTATIKINVEKLNPQFIQDLQEKYAGSALEIKVGPGRDAGRMTESLFWEIISLLDWSQAGNDEAVIAPAVEKLVSMPIHYVYGFEDLLSEKLFELDARKFAEQIGEDSYSPGNFFSVDNFLYVRCCVVANGQEYYAQVLEEPSLMPKDLAFEPLLYIAAQAYRRKTGKPFNYLPAFNYETFSNEEGWGNENEES